MRFEVFRAVKV